MEAEPPRATPGLPGCPVTGFRHESGLGAHSGGTVRESHPVVYSLCPFGTKHLKRMDFSTGYFTVFREACQAFPSEISTIFLPRVDKSRVILYNIFKSLHRKCFPLRTALGKE